VVVAKEIEYAIIWMPLGKLNAKPNVNFTFKSWYIDIHPDVTAHEHTVRLRLILYYLLVYRCDPFKIKLIFCYVVASWCLQDQ